MMLAKVNSCAIVGLDGALVDVEVDLSNGQPTDVRLKLNTSKTQRHPYSGQSGPVSWSTWSLRDKEGASWKGLFFALELSGTPSRRFVYVRVDMP